MSEIQSIGLDMADLMPFFFYIRAAVLVVGGFIIVHAFCMAGFVPQWTPWDLLFPLALTAGASVGMIIGALIGRFDYMFYSTLFATSSWGTMALALWLRGFHVSKHLQAMQRP